MDVALIGKVRSGMILKFRMEHNLSQKSAAILAEVSVNAWGYMERLDFSRSDVTSEVVAKIALLVGSEPEQIAPEELRGKRVSLDRTVFVASGPMELLTHTIEDRRLPSPDDAMIQKELVESVDQFMRHSLTERERKVLQLRWGLGDLNGKTHSLTGVAHSFGITRERVRQIQLKAQLKMSNFNSESGDLQRDDPAE